MKTAVEADWLKQLELSGRSLAESMEDVFRRGRSLAKDLKDLRESGNCLMDLGDIERRFRSMDLGNYDGAILYGMPEAKGFHLVAVDVRQITLSKEGEYDPTLMDDGTMMFIRWEYVMRFWAPTQLIWNARPDGTNPHVIGGFLTHQRCYAMPRQIPGTSKVVCIDAAHHNDGAGDVLIVNEGLPESMRGKARHLMITEAHERHNRVILTPLSPTLRTSL